MIFPQLEVQVSIVFLIIYYSVKCLQIYHSLVDKQRKKDRGWQTFPLAFRLAEDILFILFLLLIMLYFIDDNKLHINSIVIVVVAFVGSLMNIFCVRLDETPCNATIQLMSKIIVVLRFLMIFSIILKVDDKTDWDWSTTFWPYWCSFAIQGIMGIASFIIFLNTIMNFVIWLRNGPGAIALTAMLRRPSSTDSTRVKW